MTAKKVSVLGIYPHRASLEYAVSALKVGGVRDDDISVVLRENPGTQDVVKKRATSIPEDAIGDTNSGVLTGGTLSWLAGTDVIALSTLGPYLLAGPIVRALSDAGVVGAPGGLAGALVRLGMPESVAVQYQNRIENGCILLSVHCDDPGSVNKAKSTLSSTGGEDIFSIGESAGN